LKDKSDKEGKTGFLYGDSEVEEQNFMDQLVDFMARN
jgi:hypothetical protein